MAAVEAGADALGFVFVRSSPRYIDPEEAWDFACDLPPFVTKVGLMVDLKPAQFDELQEQFPFDLAQFHGNEPIPVVEECGPDIIKAIQFDPDTIEAELRRWSEVDEVEAILIDGSSGGKGIRVDWEALADVADLCDKPLILAGGLNPVNVAEAIEIVRPYAVDVSSGVESEPGVKDIDLIEDFCHAVREIDDDLDDED